MQVINHLPKSYSEESEYFSDNDFKQNSENQKIELKYQYDSNYFHKDAENNTLSLNLFSGDFNVDNTGIHIKADAEAYVGVNTNPSASSPTLGRLNVFVMNDNTSKNITVTLPQVTDNLSNGTEIEFFVNNTNDIGNIQTNFAFYIQSDKKILITGDRVVNVSGGKATIRANASLALIGLKLIIPGGNINDAYWIASGNCGI